LKKGSSRQIFDGIFAAGGITLSQVSIMTGLEPHQIQNWVKRGFLTDPIDRVYSRKQFARIVLINMLRESLQIDRICGLVRIIGGELYDDTDDLIADEELYHRYVDMLAEQEVNITDRASVLAAVERTVPHPEELPPNSRKQLVEIFCVMIYAHAAAQLRKNADDILNGLLS